MKFWRVALARPPPSFQRSIRTVPEFPPAQPNDSKERLYLFFQPDRELWGASLLMTACVVMAF
ncbi:MAG: hypothetical protein ABSG08_16630 [Terriglobales bacterium]|jgi:hypothetical protein